MKCVLVAGCGPAKKNRNWFLNFTAATALIVFAIPATAQSIVVTDTVVTDAARQGGDDGTQVTHEAPPRSITTPYKASSLPSSAPLQLLVQEPGSSEIASASGQSVIADPIVQTPSRSLPTITVSTLSFPSTAK